VAVRITSFERHFFFNELNRMCGSGGELLLKGDPTAPMGRMDIGDRLIGIGVTHLVESLSRPPGPASFRSMAAGSRGPLKYAARAFTVASKTVTPNGHDFAFAPLSPQDYCDTLATVSQGRVRMAPGDIPEGTIIMSFVDAKPTYTLQTLARSPGENWRRVFAAKRHWNVGIANDDDFWDASFPSDEVGILTQLSPSERIGSIRFGLSLLPKSTGFQRLERIPWGTVSGRGTKHHFCLSGYATGTSGLDTPFPIGLRTEITFFPQR
jgi:hypothetical protein